MRLRVDEPEVIELSLERERRIDLEITEKIVKAGGDDHEHFSGPYTIDPDFEGQVLDTQYKVMDDDITINPIEVARTSNPSGGKTVYIGGII